MTIWIGASGWHYDHWRGAFYPAGFPADEMLSFYARRFRTVEINNSFYRLPSRATFAAWRAAAPAGFLFSVKASRFVTHMKKLKDPVPAMKILFERAAGLGPKLGPVLFQLPPKWKVNVPRLRDFLAALPPRHRYAFELRNETWFTDEVFDLLDKRGAAHCLYEIAGRSSPMRLTGRFVYVRLHGPGAAYQGSYSDDALVAWANRARRWDGEGKDVYIYFDNDQAGYAVRDAERLEAMLRRAAPRVLEKGGDRMLRSSISKGGDPSCRRKKQPNRANRKPRRR